MTLRVGIQLYVSIYFFGPVIGQRRMAVGTTDVTKHIDPMTRETAFHRRRKMEAHREKLVVSNGLLCERAGKKGKGSLSHVCSHRTSDLARKVGLPSGAPTSGPAIIKMVTTKNKNHTHDGPVPPVLSPAFSPYSVDRPALVPASDLEVGAVGGWWWCRCGRRRRRFLHQIAR